MKLNIQLFAGEDGSIVIGTVVKTKGVDKGLAEIQKKIDAKNLDIELKETNLTKAEASLKTIYNTMEQTEGKINDNNDRLKELNAQLRAIEKSNPVIGNPQSFTPERVHTAKTETGYYEIEKEIKNINAETDKLVKKFDELAPGVEKAQINLQKADLQLQKSNVEMAQLINKKKQLEEPTVNNNLKDIGKGMGDVLRKVGKWTIAIFGIRSAYNYVRQAVGVLSQNNQQLAKDIENIRYGLASALEPAIKKIVEWAYKLMQAINYIWTILTGHDLFSKSKKSLQTSNKEAKKLQKTMASFDEMNVLGGNTATSGGSGGGGTASADFTKDNLLTEEDKKRLEAIAQTIRDIADALKPVWDALKPIGEWLLKNPEVILTFLASIQALKLAKWVGELGGAFGGLSKVLGSVGTGGLIGALAILDLYLVVKIADSLVNEVIPAIKETTQRYKELKEATEGNNKQQKKNIENTKEQINGLKAGTKETKASIDTILSQTKAHQGSVKTAKDNVDAMYKEKGALALLTPEFQQNKRSLEDSNQATWGYIDALSMASAQGKLTKEQAKEYIDILQQQITQLDENASHLNQNSEEYNKNRENVKKLKQQIDITKGKYDVDVQTKADQQPINDMKKAVDNLDGEYKVQMSADTKKANKSVRSWLSNLSSVGILGSFIKAGISLGTALAKFPLAKGGIINMPGKGIPIGGEAGREGVLPLTDSQQMELLGEAIGRYITINASITNTMNGRVISRELQKIQNENDFAGNR